MRRTGIVLVLLGLAALSACSKENGSVSDRSSPEAAVRSLANAIDQRNSEAVKSAFVGQTAGEKAYAEAMAELLAASKELTQAGRDRYGRDDSEELLGHANPGENEMKSFTTASPVVEGDLATLTSRTGQTLKLKKMDQQWKVVPAPKGASGQSDEPALTSAAQAMSKLAGALQQTTGQIRKGELKTVADARKAIIEKGL